MIINRLKENIIQWMTNICYQVYPLTFFYLVELKQISSPDQFWKLNSFSSPLIAKRCAEVKVRLKSHYLFFRGIVFLCVQLSKNITKCLFFLIFSTHFGINLFYFHNFKTWANNETTTPPTMWMNEIKQSKKVTSHVNWLRALLFDLAHKQCNDIINPNKAGFFDANKMWHIICYNTRSFCKETIFLPEPQFS